MFLCEVRRLTFAHAVAKRAGASETREILAKPSVHHYESSATEIRPRLPRRVAFISTFPNNTYVRSWCALQGGTLMVGLVIRAISEILCYYSRGLRCSTSRSDVRKIMYAITRDLALVGKLGYDESQVIAWGSCDIIERLCFSTPSWTCITPKHRCDKTNIRYPASAIQGNIEITIVCYASSHELTASPDVPLLGAKCGRNQCSRSGEAQMQAHISAQEA